MIVNYSITNGLGYSDPDIQLFNNYNDYENNVNSSGWILNRLLSNFSGNKLVDFKPLESGSDVKLSFEFGEERDGWLIGRMNYDDNCFSLLKIDAGINEVELLSYKDNESFELGKMDCLKLYPPIEKVEYGVNYISWHYEDGFMYLRIIR